MTEELEKQNTVGLLNFHFANNYGAVLVAWSLKKSIEALGWKTEIIDFNGDNVVTNPAFEHFQKRFLQPRTREFKTVEELEEVGDHWERIVVGSDQVFRLHKTQAYMLSWAYGNCLLTAYAASFGRDDYCSPMPIADAFSMLKRFDNLSVRESSGVDVCNELFDVQAEHVLDPTLLLDAADYDEIIDSEEHVLPETPYIAVLFYNRSGKEKFESLLSGHGYKYDVKSNTYTPPPTHK